MSQLPNDNMLLSHCYALCVGIRTYTNLSNRNLRYATADATIIAERLADPRRGNFVATVLTEPTQTTKGALEKAVEKLLSAPDRVCQVFWIIRTFRAQQFPQCCEKEVQSRSEWLPY